MIRVFCQGNKRVSQIYLAFSYSKNLDKYGGNYHRKSQVHDNFQMCKQFYLQDIEMLSVFLS